jgi:two-component system sensor histidine kinase DevS
MVQPGASDESQRAIAAERLRPASELSLTDDLVWAVLEAAPDAVLLVDGDGRIALANRRVEAMFGYDRAELLGELVETLVPEHLRGAHTAHRLRYRAEPRMRSMGADLELWGRRRDGSLVPVEIALSPVTAAGAVSTVAVVRDISDRRAADAEMRRVRNALDATRDGVYLFDPDDLHFSHVNEGAAAQTGYTREQLCTMSPTHLTPELDEQALRALLEPLRNGAKEAVEVTAAVRRRDGVELPVEMVVQYTPSMGDDPAVFVAVVRDVTEREHAQQQLLDTGRQLALLEDRERIGRDLHDRVIQRLFAAGLAMQAIATTTDDERLVERLERAVDDVDESIRDLRTVIFGLARRTARKSLRDEILGVVTESARTLSFEPNVRFSGAVDSTVPNSLWEHVLAALREILSNIAKHADATAVEVDVNVDESLLLRVRDNGVGLPAVQPAEGQGLRNLASRAASLGGTFQASRNEPSGTAVEWAVPL